MSVYRRSFSITIKQLKALQAECRRLGIRGLSELLRRIIDQWIEGPKK